MYELSKNIFVQKKDLLRSFFGCVFGIKNHRFFLDVLMLVFRRKFDVEKSENLRQKKRRIEKLKKIEKPPTFTFLFEFLPKLKKGHFLEIFFTGSFSMFFGSKSTFSKIRTLLEIFFSLGEKFSKTGVFGTFFLPVLSRCFRVNKPTSNSILKNDVLKNARRFLTLFEFIFSGKPPLQEIS